MRQHLISMYILSLGSIQAVAETPNVRAIFHIILWTISKGEASKRVPIKQKRVKVAEGMKRMKGSEKKMNEKNSKGTNTEYFYISVSTQKFRLILIHFIGFFFLENYSDVLFECFQKSYMHYI